MPSVMEEFERLQQEFGQASIVYYVDGLIYELPPVPKGTEMEVGEKTRLISIDVVRPGARISPQEHLISNLYGVGMSIEKLDGYEFTDVTRLDINLKRKSLKLDTQEIHKYEPNEAKKLEETIRGIAKRLSYILDTSS